MWESQSASFARIAKVGSVPYLRKPTTVRNRKTRTVSIRLSEQQYDELRLVSEASGAPSVSDYMRSKVFDALAAGGAALNGEFDQQIGRLTSDMQELCARVERLRAFVGLEEKS